MTLTVSRRSLFLFLFAAIKVFANPDIQNSNRLAQAEIVWSAPTNNWPERLWVYKVVPQEFSPAVISNLIALGSFTMKDRTNMLDEPTFTDKTVLFFRNADQSRHLGIYPALGWVDYNNRNAKAASQLQTVKSVPTQEEATALGLKYLRLIGIDVSDIATKRGSDELDLHWERETIGYLDPQTKANATLTNMSGVFFLRRIDGINMRGIGLQGGAEITFGNDGKIVDLQVSWRNLKPYELRTCATPQQIMDGLKNGQIILPSGMGDTNQIRKITINWAIPSYDGNQADEKQDYVVPLINLDLTTEDVMGRKAFSLRHSFLLSEKK